VVFGQFSDKVWQFSDQIWLVSGDNSSTAVSLLGWSSEKIEEFAGESETLLPSPEFAARSSLVRAVGAAL